MGTLIDFLPIILIALAPVVTYLAWVAVATMERNGNRTTYAMAVLKAVGAGQNAAQGKGLSIFTSAGRMVAAQAGADYLEATVAESAAKLGIKTLDEHKARVLTQIGLMGAEAAATATATAAIANPVIAAGIGVLNTMQDNARNSP